MVAYPLLQRREESLTRFCGSSRKIVLAGRNRLRSGSFDLSDQDERYSVNGIIDMEDITMSGHKVTRFQLNPEQDERLRLLSRARGLQGEFLSLHERIQTSLSKASEGLRRTFQSEVQRAQQWLDKSLALKNFSPNESSQTSELRRFCTEVERAVQDGQSVYEDLTVAFTQKADELGCQFAKRLTAVEKLYHGRQELLRLWYREETNWERELHQARQWLDQERYSELESLLSELHKRISEKARQAEEMEEKHQKRLYLLQALQRVCREMGFVEIQPPTLEREDERGSRIIYKVDTLDRGQIVFALSLEEVNSYSEIADTRCFEEFDQISQFLEEQFGIYTQFESAEGKPRPELKYQKEEVLSKSQSDSASAGA